MRHGNLNQTVHIFGITNHTSYQWLALKQEICSLQQWRKIYYFLLCFRFCKGFLRYKGFRLTQNKSDNLSKNNNHNPTILI